MKKIYSFLLFFIVSGVIAQIPAGYYDTATGTGYTLKTQLYNIIKGHTDNGYAGLYITYATSDIDNFYENDGSVLDMYSENPTATDPYTYSIATTQRCGNYTNEGDCYNREHIIPQSIFNEASPMRNDAHFITPTDGKVNGIRSNYPHSVVAVPTITTQNGSKLGESTTAGYTGPVFEPIDEFKGDIARMYFYFATRYENTVAGYSYAMFNGTSNKVFTPAFLSVLIAWHNQDPVNAREITRNNAIYARQNNRNPYIDHPEYVQAIWNPVADTQAPTAASNLAVTGTTSSTVSLSWTAGTDNVAVTSYDIYMNGVIKTSVPGLTTTIMGLTASTTYSFYVIAKDASVNSSPASNTVNGTTTIFIPDTETPTEPTNLAVTGSSSSTVSLSWTASTDNIGVTSYDVYVNSAFKSSVSGTTAIVNGLTPVTTYSFYVVAKDAAGNSSLQSNSVNGTTTIISSSCASESFEKIPAAASSYGTKTWTGDSGLNWTATDARTDQAISTRAICIRNGSLSASISADGIGSLTVTTQQKFTTGNSGTFSLRVNGNIVGTIPFGAPGVETTTTISNINIAGDVTISITDNSNLTTSRVAFDNLSWTCYSNLNNEEFNSTEFSIYPNPATNQFSVNFKDGDGSFSIAIYSILGQKVFEKQNTTNKIVETQNLSKGTYILKITKDSKTLTRKLLVN
ncbi:endonuclease [Flavobacterium geliluteum]|uniref:Endonuclease n=1 Tax=Flavobacterium geliluteum TaxID=2816120 RepID=A0A940XCS8_9FLAO|nr:endonuclease [Flavobacterium geliluteum]MBP4140102.1 endonuclease [Flavobacterium geliluteum]